MNGIVMTTDELVQQGYLVKACPFCGSLGVKVSYFPSDEEPMTVVMCERAGCGTSRGFVRGGIADALNEWNERVSVPAVSIAPLAATGA